MVTNDEKLSLLPAVAAQLAERPEQWLDPDYVMTVVRLLPRSFHGAGEVIVRLRVGEREISSDAQGGLHGAVTEPVFLEGLHCGELAAGYRQAPAQGEAAGFGPSDLELLREAAALIGRSLERRKREAHLLLAVMRNRTLLKLTEYAHGKSDEQLLSFTLAQAEKLTLSPVAYAHFVTEDEAAVLPGAWSANTLALHPVDEAAARTLAPQGAWLRSLHTRSPVIDNDSLALQDLPGLPDGRGALRRHLCVPVIEGGRVVMLMGLGDKEQPYDLADAELLHRMALSCWSLLQRNRAEKALKRSLRALSAIRACTAAIVRATDPAALLQEVCGIAVDSGAYRMAWIGVAEHDEAHSVKMLAWAGQDRAYLDSLKVSWGDNEWGRGPTGTCIREGRVVVMRDSERDPQFAPWRGVARQYGFRSSCSFPFPMNNSVAALMVYSVHVDAFGEDEIAIFSELAQDLAHGLKALRQSADHQRAMDLLIKARGPAGPAV